MCADQVLVDLVGKDRIAAVTHLARDPLTAVRPERFAGIRQTHGAAEDVLSLRPDLVFASAYASSATVDLLRRLGLRIELVAQPDTIDGVRDVIRQMAAVVGEAARGAALITAMDVRIDAARLAASDRRPTALVYQVNNFVSVSGGLIDEALSIAGYGNGASGLRLARSGQVGVETIITAAVDLIVLGSSPTDYRTAMADNLRHPALMAIERHTPTVVLPWPLWLCGTHHIAEAVEQLSAARQALPSR